MNVRRARAEDYEAIATLWRDFDHEVPPPIHEGPADQEKELAEFNRLRSLAAKRTAVPETKPEVTPQVLDLKSAK